MLYNSTVLLIQGCAKIHTRYTSTVSEALRMTMDGGKLDVYLMKSPVTLMGVESTTRQIYELCRHEAVKQGRTKVSVCVLLDGLDFDPSREQTWECVVTGNREPGNESVFRKLAPENSDVQKLPVVFLRMDEEMEEEVETGDDDDDSDDHHKLMYTRHCEQNAVIVAGTFDHFHDGHKLLLTLAGYLARERLVVGITGPEMLKNKKYARAMQSYARRTQSVEEFLTYLFPLLKVDTAMIHDVYGPTQTDENLDALVLSAETRSGGAAVNKMRREKQWPELKLFEVDLIGGSANAEDKLSSTELRRLELELELESDTVH